MLENEILRNYSPKLWVSWGVIFNGLGGQKTPDILLAKTTIEFEFYFPVFFRMLSNKHRKKQYSKCPDLINTEKSLSLLTNIYSLVY